MKKIWFQWADRFDALQPRERLIVFLGTTAILLCLGYALAFSPMLKRQRMANIQIAQSDATMTALLAQEAALMMQASQDPDAESRRVLHALRASNVELRQQLNGAQAQLASPEKMTSLLRDLIASQKGLELVSMRALPARDLLAERASAPAAVAVNSVFRHGIEITVKGPYAALAAYTRQIEKLPWKIYQENLLLNADAYPVSTMTVTLYTLSMERAWLSF